MTLIDSFAAALQSLAANKLRSVLTTLGIIIGVGAVIVMVAVGAGVEARVDGLIRSLGSNLIYVLPGSARSGAARLGRGSLATITWKDAVAIAREIDAVAYAAPSASGNAQVVFGNANWATRVSGVTPDVIPAREWQIESGRNLMAADVKRIAKVALLGATVAQQLFPEGDALGKTIRIKRVPFRVIGVLVERGETPLGRDQDDLVMVPLTTAKKRVFGGRRLSGDRISSITVKVREGASVLEAEEKIRILLRQRHRGGGDGQDRFTIRNLAEFLRKRQESSQIMALLLAAVASISMLVGGIGIMNIMLVTVTERTREIGLRVALGARRRDILAQFLIESILLSLVGGVIGVVLGYAGAYIATHLGDWPLEPRPEAGVVAFIFAGLVGIFFGFYPAHRASRLDPIEALRHE